MSRSVPSLPASAAALLRSHRVGSLTSKAQEKRWHPGLRKPQQHPCHNEIFAHGNCGSGAGLALALARDALKTGEGDRLAEIDDQRHILWVQTKDAIRRSGRPYHHGLPPELRRRLIHVAADTAQDALFALEEGVRCRDLAFVVGEIAGNPREMDFTASRRLTLTAQKYGSRLYLVRIDAKPDLSSARMRWNVRSAPSPRPRWNASAPGIASWKAELFRARAHPPGKWSLHDDAGTLAIATDAVSRPSVAIPHPANNTAPAADYGNMARATVGRSLAAL